MSEVRIHTYEGMFLFPHAAVSNMQAAVDHLKEILGRAEAQLLSLRKWDERRLAFEINGNKRGLYFLVYFRAGSDKMTGIERDCNLSEQIMRHIVLRADHVTQETIESMEGQQELADEIKLRAEKEADREETASVQAGGDSDSSEDDDDTVEESADEEPQAIGVAEG